MWLWMYMASQYMYVRDMHLPSPSNSHLSPDYYKHLQVVSIIIIPFSALVLNNLTWFGK